MLKILKEVETFQTIIHRNPVFLGSKPILSPLPESSWFLIWGGKKVEVLCTRTERNRHTNVLREKIVESNTTKGCTQRNEEHKNKKICSSFLTLTSVCRINSVDPVPSNIITLFTKWCLLWREKFVCTFCMNKKETFTFRQLDEFKDYFYLICKYFNI